MKHNDDCGEQLATLNDQRFNFAVLEVRDAINYFGITRFVRDLVRADPGLAKALKDELTMQFDEKQDMGVLLKGR